MDILSNLTYAKGSRRPRKRVGRGEGSGHGKTSTRGNNGQMSRSGAKHRSWFEGGQMPLQRRVPKFGFTNIFKVYYQVVNVRDFQLLAEANKLPSETLDAATLLELGLITTIRKPIKILGSGEISTKIEVVANAFSKSALEKIEAAGGTIKKI